MEIQGIVEYLTGPSPVTGGGETPSPPLPSGQGRGEGGPENRRPAEFGALCRLPSPQPSPKGRGGPRIAVRGTRQAAIPDARLSGMPSTCRFSPGRLKPRPRPEPHGRKKYRPESGIRWLADWIRNPAQFQADTAMPQLILEATPDAAADIAAYLASARRNRRRVGRAASPTGTDEKRMVGLAALGPSYSFRLPASRQSGRQRRRPNSAHSAAARSPGAAASPVTTSPVSTTPGPSVQA